MKKTYVVLILAFIVGLAFSLWWNNGQKAVNSNNKATQIFVIEKGEGVREIGSQLKKEGLIRDQVAFFISVKLSGKDRQIQAGDYRLSPSMSLSSLIDNLTHGTLDIWVTVPEGLRAEEIADILKGSNFINYNNLWEQTLLASNGYLFPDTYLIPKNAEIETIVSLMENNFYNKISQLGLDKNYQELNNIVIIASLVERETKGDAEKPIVAGILYNRLDSGMALQIDATIQYAKGYDSVNKKWWSPITVSDYKAVNSPYNTYLLAGLPPSPISNPGFKSLEAAASPAKTPYFYYLHDGKGVIHYAKTMTEHNSNIRKYLSSR